MTKRDSAIISRYKEGYSMTEVAREFGITRQRVHQIISPVLSDRHYGSNSRSKRTALISEAYARILTNNSTVKEEARALGMRRDSLCHAFREKGFILPPRPAPEHGTRYRYAQGCRCDECHRAVAEYQRRFVGREPPKHGTQSAYTNYACRCDACRAAGSQKNREYRERRKALVAT